MRGLITPLITTDEPPSRASGSEIRAPRLYPGGWGFGLRMSFWVVLWVGSLLGPQYSTAPS